VAVGGAYSSSALGLDTVRALVREPGYLPDFLVPPPQRQETSFADELARIRATPADTVRAELDKQYRGKPLPAPLRELSEHPTVRSARWSTSCAATGTSRSNRCGRACTACSMPT
jgi:hypothetical protein